MNGMRLQPLLYLLCLLILTAPAPARAIDFSLLGGLNYAAPTQTLSGADQHWTGESGFSFGGTVGISLWDLPFDFETGAFLLNENSSSNSVISSRKNKMLQIPFVVRYNFDEHIGLGVGGYFAFGQGNVESTVGGLPVSSSYSAAGESDTDSGLILNLRARFNLAPPFYFILDARYQHGLSDRSLSPGDVFNTRSIQGFAGFQFSLLSADEGDQRYPY